MRNSLIACSLLLQFSSFAQNTTPVKQWQEENPHKLFMSVRTFQGLDSSYQNQLKDRVVFIEDLKNPEASSALEQIGDDVTVQYESENFVKLWLASNNTVKIVKRSQYDQANPDQKEMYDLPHIMVLIGEDITRKDIENFEQ
ncbi:MAG: hypothetical protein ACFHU9_12620 [Fluviicola sp.]